VKSINYDNKSITLPLKVFLRDIKFSLNAGNFSIAHYRSKNKDFIKEYGFTIDNIKSIILKLSPTHALNKTSEPDLDGFPGFIYKFSYPYEKTKIYIKIRFNPPDEIVCISFHT